MLKLSPFQPSVNVAAAQGTSSFEERGLQAASPCPANLASKPAKARAPQQIATLPQPAAATSQPELFESAGDFFEVKIQIAKPVEFGA